MQHVRFDDEVPDLRNQHSNKTKVVPEKIIASSEESSTAHVQKSVAVKAASGVVGLSEQPVNVQESMCTKGATA